MESPPRSPLPKKLVLILFFMTFADGLSLNFYNTITTLMMTFQFGIPSDQVGYYVGYLATAYYIGQLLCNFPLSFLSDRIGRKPVLLLGLTSNIFCQLIFGLSKWYWVAVLARFINGFTNANLPLTKCFVRESSDVSNQARLFSFRSVGLSIGSLTAPIIGSLFSRPSDQQWLSSFPFFGSPIFESFPYFLVCVVVCCIDSICLIVLIFYMPETLASKIHTEQAVEVEMEEMSLTSDFNDHLDDNTLEIDVESNLDMEENMESIEIETEEVEPVKKGMKAFLQAGVLITVGLYVILSFTTNSVIQIVPIWATRDKAEHGLSFEETQLGVMYSAGSISALLFQLFLFSPIDKWLGSADSFRSSIIMAMPVIFLIPCTSFFTDYVRVMWVMLAVLYGSFVIQLSWAFGAINVLMSNASTKDIVGSVNGISSTLAAFAKLVAPVLADTLFAWSANLNFYYPFNYMFVFHCAVLVSLFCLFITMFLPENLSRNRVQ